MRKITLRRTGAITSALLFISLCGCVKDTYNMDMLSKKAHLSPGLAISAITGDILFSDMVKSSDTVQFDQNNFVTLVFKNTSAIDLKLPDFAKGTLIQKTAIIDPGVIDMNIKDIMRRITGTFKVLNPSVRFNYNNAFSDSLKVAFSATAKRDANSLDLITAPFKLDKPVPPQQEISSTHIIDKNNSNISDLVSMPPDEIDYSGTVTLTSSQKNSASENILAPDHLTGSIEVNVPLELQINNLQFSDTSDNFLKTKDGDDNPLKPEDIQSLQIIITAKNGFPLGLSFKMSLYDSGTHSTKSTINAGSIFNPAPIDNSGKVTGTSDSKTSIDFTSEFFNKINSADKIIFTVTLNSTGDGLKDVKIYSDNHIEFTAALIVKPDINLK